MKEYFNNNGGLFAALALFTFLMVDTLETNLFLSFVSYFFVFLLLAYLVWDMNVPKNGWEGLLQLGYLIFFISLLSYGNGYGPILSGAPQILFYIPTLFYGVALIRMIYKFVKRN